MRGVRTVSLVVAAALLCSLVVGPISFVGADGKSASFVRSSASEDRGDVIPITVHASKAATINIGSPEEGFWVQVNVTSGTTTLNLNTYWADRPTKVVTLESGGIRGTPNVKIPSETGPLQPGVYDLNVTVGGITQDIASFTVEERETGEARTLVLPKPERTNASDFETTDDLLRAASATENGTIAKGDQFVLALDASGLSGFLDRPMLNGSGENVSVHFRESNAERNTVPNEFDGDEATRLMIDDENDVVYLVLDTDGHGIEVGDTYEVTFEIGVDNDLVTEPERATTNFSVEEPRVSLDYSGDVLVVQNRTEIGGTTNLAPGTTINVTAYDTGAKAFFWPKTVTVSENRTFDTTFDFSGVEPGTSFVIELRDQDVSVTGVVASGPKTTPTPPPTRTTTGPTTTATTTTTTTTTSTTAPTTTETTTSPVAPTERPITAQSVSEGGLPGFDESVALVALGAAAVLVLRRPR